MKGVALKYEWRQPERGCTSTSITSPVSSHVHSPSPERADLRPETRAVKIAHVINQMAKPGFNRRFFTSLPCYLLSYQQLWLFAKSRF